MDTGEGKNKRKMAFICAAFLLMFYFVIVSYVYLFMMTWTLMPNYIAGMIYEVIGFLIASYVVLKSVGMPQMKLPYLISILCVTIFYVVICNCINVFGMGTMVTVKFVFLHLVLLFLYCLISIPMYIMGKK